MMKKICLLVSLICLFICSVTTAQAEVQYLGELCITLGGAAADGHRTIQLGILSYGTDTFPVYGKIRRLVNEQVISIPFHGTAILDGTTVTMSLNASNTGVGLFAGTYSISFDLQTLVGTYNSITYDQFQGLPNPSQPYTISTLYGPVTAQVCP